MKTKFSKGPWKHTPPGPADSQGYGVCALWGTPGSEEQIANSHLISAAPEMYGMLETIFHIANGETEFSLDEFDMYKVVDLLAKARGEID